MSQVNHGIRQAFKASNDLTPSLKPNKQSLEFILLSKGSFDNSKALFKNVLIKVLRQTSSFFITLP